MDKKGHYLAITICIIAMVFFSSGCIEVTPSTGSTNASTYGLNHSGGNLTSYTDSGTPSATGTVSDQKNPTSEKNQSSSGPDVKLPVPPVQRVVPATPIGYRESPTVIPPPPSSISSSKGKNETIISIFNVNRTFENIPIAFSYNLEKPPLFVDLKFSPEMGTEIISFDKRTGDKEGMTDIVVVRPLKDSWFELRVYDKKSGSLVLQEGYGKLYSQDNKSVAIRTAGSYQFDLIGDKIDAFVNFTIPVPENELYLYQDVLNQISNKKEEANRIPGVFLVIGDLPAGWEGAGDILRTDINYQSMFKKEGITLRQKIKKFTSSDLALAELESLRTAAGSDSMSPSVIGQKGFVVDKSQVKTQLAFVEGLYLVELSSFTPPNPVPVSDLQAYGKIIITRIQSSGKSG